MTQKKQAPKLETTTKKELEKLPTKSSQIRYLRGLGYEMGDISRILTRYYGKEVRFQHVRNVLMKPLKNG